MDTDRNLLFGVLALQTDLLTADQFVQACTAWTTRKQTPLADLLLERGWITAEDRADVERLLVRKLKKHGSARSSLAALTTDEVRESLAAVSDPDLRAAAPPPAAPGPVSTTAYVPGAEGRYTRTRLHATGGIGQVWLARDGSLGRDVALKELRPERRGQPSLRARFLQEAQVTGQIEHPGVVPIYELAARPDDDEPFYTMRFVRGRTLTQAVRSCHERRRRGEAGPLEFRELLTACVAVCNAVAYAHSRGVVHRDLKPHNVVLGDYGEVMVLDWGLAKVLGAGPDPTPLAPAPVVADTADNALETQPGEVLGTPAYMAPEQADGRTDRVDARTDVYGLGAILYEVLTGRAPFDGATSEEVLQKVRHESPPRPRSLAGVPPALEAVCLKALARDPARRYASARDLAQDLDHYLADEPTTAYREPAAVRLARWGRRNRTLVAASAALLLAAVVGLTAGTILLDAAKRQTAAQRDRALRAEADSRTAAETVRSAEADARRSAARAQAINSFLVNDLLEQANPQNNPVGARITVRELLDRAARKVRTSAAVAAEPDVGASVHLVLGRSYSGLGLYPEAEEHLRKAVDLRARARGADDPAVLTALNNLAICLWYQNKLGEAEAAFRRILDAQGGRDPQTRELLTRQAMNNLGLVLRKRAKFPQAEQIQRRLLEAARRTYGPDHVNTLNSMNNLANVLIDQGKNEEAEQLLREQLAARRRVQGDNHPSTATAIANLGLVLVNLHRYKEAEGLLREAVERHRNVLGPEHPLTANAIRWLAEAHRRQDKRAEAEKGFREALAVYRKKLPPTHPSLGECLADLGLTLLEDGRPADAEPLLREARTVRRKGLPPKHPDIAESESLLGACLTDRRRYAEAEPLLLAAYEQQRAAEPGRAGTTAGRLVKLYEAWGKPDQAARWRARVPPKGGTKGKG